MHVTGPPLRTKKIVRRNAKTHTGENSSQGPLCNSILFPLEL